MDETLMIRSQVNIIDLYMVVFNIILRKKWQDLESWEAVRQDEESEIHGRVLKVKTNDYGRYDPAPSFVKPPFKLIPN